MNRCQARCKVKVTIRASRLGLAATVVFAILTANSAWYVIGGSARQPFADLRWIEGYPEVYVDNTWFELVSIDGVPADSLVKSAISLWGPGYQDRFAPRLAELMRLRGSGLGLTSQLVLASRTAGTRQTRRTLNSGMNWRRYAASQATREQVFRPRVAPLPKSLEYVARRIDGRTRPLSGDWVSELFAKADLSRLEWLLVHHYAYLKSSSDDYKAALDWIASDLGSGISRRDLALQLARVFALLHDGHTEVQFDESRIHLPSGELPCALESVEGRVACLREDRRGFFDSAHPFVRGINGESIDRLIALAGEMIPNTSEETHRRRALRLVRRVGFVSALLGRPPWDPAHPDRVQLQLESEGANNRIVMLADIRRSGRTESYALPIHSRILPGRVGYVAMRAGLFPDEAFQQEIVQAMQSVRETRALILDLRGNSGGTRHAALTLLTYFVPPGDTPRVLNVGAVRMDAGIRPPPGFDLLKSRLMYSRESSNWTSSEREYIGNFFRHFRPEMELGKDLYSDYHVMLTPARTRPGAYFYSGPVVVLQDEYCGSATEILLSALKGLPQITLLGMQSAGGSGYPVAYRLPATGIVVRISSMASFRPDGRVYEGTQPDIQFQRTLSSLKRELQDSADPLLEAAAELLVGEAAVPAAGGPRN
ncbi:MAG: S41 family peptidase [Blastocatellia bacterium]